MSTLRRLSHQAGTMASYSPEPATWRDGDSLTNCGRRCVGKSKKISLIHVSLVYSTGKIVHSKGFQSASATFRAKIRSQHPVWTHGAEVDALFRIIWVNSSEPATRWGGGTNRLTDKVCPKIAKTCPTHV